MTLYGVMAIILRYFSEFDSFRGQLRTEDYRYREEIVNVNFLYDDIVHVLQNTIDSCINSATDRRGYVLERMFTKFSEITQRNGHYAVQGHSRSPIFCTIRNLIYNCLLVISTNLPLILHR